MRGGEAWDLLLEPGFLVFILGSQTQFSTFP